MMSKIKRLPVVGKEENEDSDAEAIYLRTSYSLIDYVKSREVGLNERRSVSSEFATRHIISHDLFKEHRLSLNNMNKVFCSQWLSDRQIAFGTKCNKLMVYDVVTRKLDHIPLLGRRRDQPVIPEQCGIHAAQLNPSKTLLATGAKNPNELSVYRLPTMDALCVGENAHTGWVSDFCWVDDQFLVSGARDSKMALWKIEDDPLVQADRPSYFNISPVSVKLCKGGYKIRAIAYNPNYRQIAAMSLNGKIHIWNAETFRQTHSKELFFGQENVCIAVKDGGLYGIGCYSFTLLLDPRTLNPVKKIIANFSGCGYFGICSASFQGNILTIGTDLSTLMFYDLRAHKYLESSSRFVASLTCSPVNVLRDDDIIEQQHVAYIPEIYTHCYDTTGTRIFAAGGPQPAIINGAYAAIWQ